MAELLTRDSPATLARPLLDIAGLNVAYRSPAGWNHALQDVSLAIPAGSVLGLVGESGSGKSSVVLALLGLLGPAARMDARSLAFDGQDLRRHAPALRGRRIGVVFQDTAAALNPAMTIGRQLAEPMILHLRRDPAEARDRATALLAEMGITRPAQVMRSYPHQLSGGMKQRVGIAAGLATEPDLLLLDEPTTALDVTIEAQILALLDDIRARRGLSMLLVSHNLGIVDRLADRVAVLYAGRIAEAGPTAEVLHHPRHPYTKGLLAALPRPDRPHPGRLSPIAGTLPDPAAPSEGCNFLPRCPFAAPGCEALQRMHGQTSCHRAHDLATTPWPTVASTPSTRAIGRPLIVAEHLSASFGRQTWLGRRLGRPDPTVLAVDDVSLTLHAGEILGLVGESGCGKSTLGRLLLRLVPSRSGTLHLDGEPVPAGPGKGFHRRAQIVFQNPDTALNPRQTVGAIIARPLHWFGLATRAETGMEVARLLDLVRLPQAYASRFPHQLSGGEKQRVGIARALASRPDVLVCDEAVSALDVSVQAAILNLLADIRDNLGMAYLFISHDIGVIAHAADRVAVMYAGSIVEEGAVMDALHPPCHPYTELLLSSVPLVGRPRRTVATTPAGGARPSSNGCRFAPRCPRKLGPVCDTSPPPWQQAAPGHRIRCHIPPVTLAAFPSWLEPIP